MPLRPAAIILNVSDTERARRFWSEAVGYSPKAEQPDFLLPPSGDGVRIHLDRTDRMHLDLWVDHETSDLETEVERLIGLGATRVDWDYPDDADFVVLADTEGNLFCVID